MTAPCDDPQPHHHRMPVGEEWLSTVVQALRADGQRQTVPRHAILAWIADAQAPFSAEVLVRELEARKGISSRATVYRLLDWLRAHGWIERIYSDGEQTTFARLLPGHHHHVVCTQCGTTLVVGGCDVEHIFAPILDRLDFAIHSHTLTLHGLCARCRSMGAP
jgi:Fur family ferric uptake transcriptional regulator